MSSSGTSSGLNLAGVTHGNLSLTGSNVTITSPLAENVQAGNTKGGSIAVQLTSCLTGLESALQQVTIFVFICKTD